VTRGNEEGFPRKKKILDREVNGGLKLLMMKGICSSELEEKDEIFSLIF